MKKIYTSAFYILLLISILFKQTTAQDESIFEFTNEVTKTFYATSLISTQTSEVIPLGQLKFTIKHRFGRTDINKDFLKDFFGMDLSSNIRFGFQVPLTERWYVGVGRTKYEKQYDLESKYALLKQKLDNSMPLNLSLYIDAAIKTDDFPKRLENFNYFQSDSTTEFNYKFNHRMSYNYQIILSRKFAPWLSAQVSPQLIYRNLVAPGKDNMQIAIPMGLRFKVAMFSSIIIDYIPLLNNPNEQRINPWGIGYEIGTPGHSFQFFVSNSPNIMNPHIYSNSRSDITEGQFYIGFNIHRYLWTKKESSTSF